MLGVYVIHIYTKSKKAQKCVFIVAVPPGNVWLVIFMIISVIRLSMQLIISANNLVPLYSGFQDESPVNHKEKMNISWEIKNRKPKNSNTYQI